MAVRKSERHMNLVAFLLNSKRPQDLESIRDNIYGYGDGSLDTLKRRFERDKDELRKLGIPIDHSEDGYFIDRDQYYLPEIILDADEVAAIGLLLRLLESLPDIPLHQELPAAALKALFNARQNVEAAAEELPVPAPPPPAVIHLSETQRELIEAVDEAVIRGKSLTFDYVGVNDASPRRRTADIYGRYYRQGSWYLAARDHERGDLRTFRSDRITGPATINPANPNTADYEIPGDFSLADIADREIWSVSDSAGDGDAVEARIRFKKGAPRSLVRRFLGQGAGDADVALVKVHNSDAFVEWLLGFSDKVELLGPPELVDRMIRHLEEVIASSQESVESAAPGYLSDETPARSDHTDAFAPTAEAEFDEEPMSTRGAITGPIKVSNQLERLLLIVPYIIRNQGAAVPEVCQLFGVTEKQLQADLDLAFLCGVPPYTPVDLIDARIEDGYVYIDMADYLARPTRLTPSQATALLVCLEMISRMPIAASSQPLQGLSEKIRDLVGPGGQETVEKYQRSVWFDLEPGAADHIIQAVGSGISARVALRIEYLAADGTRSQRTVDPYFVLFFAGNWYLIAYCEMRRAVRTFRLDRLASAELTDRQFTMDLEAVPEHLMQGQLFGDDPQNIAEPVRLSVSKRVARLGAQFGKVIPAGDRFDLVVTAPAYDWLVPRLLQWGAEAQVTDSPALTAKVAEQANALRIRYNEITQEQGKA